MTKKGNLEILEISDRAANGNTKKQPNQLLSWFFTLNNYTEKDISDLIEVLEIICDKYIFEKEVGSICNTPHLQGVIFLKKKMRWSEFGLTNRIQWKPTKSETASVKYCQKEFHWDGNDIYYKGITLINRQNLEIPIKNTWVLYIEDVVKSQICNKRLIHWFWSKEGNFGKSTLLKYLAERYDSKIISCPNTANNMMNLVYNEITDVNKVNTLLISLPRSFKSNNELYTGLETIKDGIVSNLKSYKNGSKLFIRPHIFIFANWRPATEKLSSDRWMIHNIDFMNDIKCISAPKRSEMPGSSAHSLF